MADDIEERARKRREERAKREKAIEDELKQWEEERKQRIEERRKRRAALEAGERPTTPSSEPTNATTSVADSTATAPSPPPSAPSSDSIGLNKRETKKKIQQELDAWEEDRKKRLAEREQEAEDRRKQMEDMIKKEEEERQKRLEQRRKEREERQKAEEEAEALRKAQFEERRLARLKEHEDQMKKMEEERASRQLARQKLQEDSEAKAKEAEVAAVAAAKARQEAAEKLREQAATAEAAREKAKAEAAAAAKATDASATPATPAEGPASPPSKPKLSTTERAIPSVEPPNFKRLTLHEVFSVEGGAGGAKKPDAKLLRAHFTKEGRLTRDACREILLQAKEILAKEPNVVTLDAPQNVIGDLHGQYYDMLSLLEKAGEPGPGSGFLFLGDYVDRGTFACEICIYLFALKINYPTHITLLRGNHETRAMAMTHNFYAEAKTKYGEDLYELFQQTFDALPLAAIVETKEMGRFFCCHGGLSPSFKTIDEINEIDRFQEPPDDGGLCDIIWSDPIADDKAANQNFTRNREREVSWVYGYNPLIDFLDENKITSIIRAHQVKEVGFEEHKFSQTPEDRKYPLVITVFSAPNYCDSYQNTGAYLKLSDEEYIFHQFTWTQHPYCFNNFINAFTFSLPFVCENLMKFILQIQEIVDSQEDKDDDSEEQSLMETKVKNAGRAMLLLQKWREENMAKLKKLGETTEAPRSALKSKFAGLIRKAVALEKSRFSAAKEADMENEKLHSSPELKERIDAVRRKSRASLSAFLPPEPNK